MVSLLLIGIMHVLFRPCGLHVMPCGFHFQLLAESLTRGFLAFQFLNLKIDFTIPVSLHVSFWEKSGSHSYSYTWLQPQQTTEVNALLKGTESAALSLEPSRFNLTGALNR